ncbi:MAG TPA: metalloregulator ArsR/SmtB family transcription factor [Spirochaetota bacterium]|nr:metalloregulator ArsR/SmtB family transcription factor [Spirochaetota bacterium]
MKALHYFKALSDQTRIRLVKLLEYKELSVNEVMAVLGMGQSRVSRHLKILTDSGLLKFRRDGLWVFYSTINGGDGRTLMDSLGFLFDDAVFANDRKIADDVAAQRVRETRNFFDSIAGEWDKIRSDLLDGFDSSLFITTSNNRYKTSLDLGCGTGDFLSQLLSISDRVIGIDNSPVMLEIARKRFEGATGKIDLRLGELEHLPLPDREADFALLNMVMHHLASPLDCFMEANRVLTAGGILKIIEFDKHTDERLRIEYGDRHLGFSEDEVLRYLEMSSFTRVSSESLSLKNGLVVRVYTSIAA